MRPVGRGMRALTALASLALGHLPAPSNVAAYDTVRDAAAGQVVGGFASTTVALSLHATAATFSVPVTPTPTAVRRGVNVHLSWQAVTISSGDVVRYLVLRHGTNSVSTEACTGADAPVTSGGLVTCIDRKPGSSGTYTVQAYVTTPAGATTWTLPASPSVSA